MSTLTRILLNRAGPKVTRKIERKVKKRERRKTEHSYVFISLNLLSESYPLAGRIVFACDSDNLVFTRS